MNQPQAPQDFVEASDRLDPELTPNLDWRKPSCPRAAWFALGAVIGSLVTWSFLSSYGA